MKAFLIFDCFWQPISECVISVSELFSALSRCVKFRFKRLSDSNSHDIVSFALVWICHGLNTCCLLLNNWSISQSKRKARGSCFMQQSACCCVCCVYYIMRDMKLWFMHAWAAGNYAFAVQRTIQFLISHSAIASSFLLFVLFWSQYFEPFVHCLLSRP